MEKPIDAWHCWDCDAMLTATANVSDDQTRCARDGDALMCVECGAPAVMTHGEWTPITQEIFDRLPPRLRREMAIAMIAREMLPHD
jgi:hypothetical protein